MTFGINWDVHNEPAYNTTNTVQVAQDFQGFRCVMRASNQPRIEYLKSLGLLYMGVYTPESQGYLEPLADYIQVHNEPEGGFASAHITPQKFVNEYTTIRSHAADVLGLYPKWVFPGLHRGPPFDEAWLSRVLHILDGAYMPDAIALHLYTHSPASAQDYCDRMWNQFQLPIACTEWFRSAPEGHHAFQCVMGGPSLDGQGARCGFWNSFFCLNDNMTLYSEGTRLGLYNENGDPKDEYYSLLSAPQECRQ